MREDAPLTSLRANARRLRAIYAWLTLAGVAGCGLLGAYLGSGEKLEGPAIAVAVVVSGLALIGGGMLLMRWRWDAQILRTLLREPQRIARVYRKETETTVHGATAARYHWLVLELTDGTRLDVYSSAEDLERVLAEIRRCAPDAHYDGAWLKERMNLRLR
jgi:hypothetical protein